MSLFPSRNAVLEAEKREMEWKAKYFQALSDLRAANRGLLRLSRNYQRVKDLNKVLMNREVAKVALGLAPPTTEASPVTVETVKEKLRAVGSES
jgi:hypothetical protein